VFLEEDREPLNLVKESQFMLYTQQGNSVIRVNRVFSSTILICGADLYGPDVRA
jgi:hypothetical protein